MTIASEADIVTARQKGRQLAATIGFSSGEQTLVALVISEMARNIVSYAYRGEVTFEAVQDGGRRGIVIVARDEGPGIADVDLAMRDGYSTGKSLGMGLPGAKRVMDEFDIQSTTGAGHRRYHEEMATVTAATGIIDWAFDGQALEDESGDLHAVLPFRDGVLVALVDGLGHGPEAAIAAQEAVKTLALDPSRPVSELLTRCHQGIRKTRGVAMSVASIVGNQVHWAGIGNVDAVIIRGEEGMPRVGIGLRGGVVGYQTPTPRIDTVPWAPGDTLIMVTDGIRSDYADTTLASLPPKQIAKLILAQFAKGTDDAHVVVARYSGRPS